MSAPVAFWVVTTFLFGITIGSFLNVVIYRLPRNGSLLEPQYSYCPTCKNQLQAIDLVPLFSFLLLGRRCRRCKKPISWRYFTVELLTGLLFVALYLRFPNNALDCVALLLFASVMVPIYFCDLDTFTIPISLNLLATLIPLGRDFWGIATHEAGHELFWGWLPRSILGAIVGILIFGVVRLLGWLWKRQEAMGLGDVFLARGMGAMLISVVPAGWHPLSLFPVWVLLSCFAGIIVGIPMIAARERKAAATPVKAGAAAQADDEDEGEDAGDGTTFRMQLGDILEVLLCLDAVEYLGWKFHELKNGKDKPYEGLNLPWRPKDWHEMVEEELDGTPPAPTAIPFGPFLVIGFFATVFVGAWITTAYMAYYRGGK